MLLLMNKYMKKLSVGLAVLLSFAASAESDIGDTPSITPRVMADTLHMVIESGRTVYTQTIVNRLVREDKVIKVSEHFVDQKALALPAQLFRLGAEVVDENIKKSGGLNISYSLRSLWPVREKNAPRTAVEERGLKHVSEHQDDTYYTQETIDGERYFTAVYADIAVSPVCVSCHNTHKYSPRRDFELGDVMGGVVIRIGLDN